MASLPPRNPPRGGSIGAIVQARMSSRRLPGKVLREVGGRPLLGYLMERLAACDALDRTVVATSVDASDDPIEEFCRRSGWACVRGDLHDVAGRFETVLNHHPFDAFVRICADGPLLDPAVVSRGVSLFRSGGFDLVTNVSPRTFPPGQSVEVVATAAFRRALDDMSDGEDREHVTRVFYRNPHRYRICNFAGGAPADGLSMVVDTEDDFTRLERVIAAMDGSHLGYGLNRLTRLFRETEAVTCG